MPPAGQTKPTPVVAVESIRAVQKFGNVKAFCSVAIGGLKIHDCKILQQEGKEAWVALPSARFEVNGQTKYKTLVEVPDHVMKAIPAAVLAAWRTQAA